MFINENPKAIKVSKADWMKDYKKDYFYILQIPHATDLMYTIVDSDRKVYIYIDNKFINDNTVIFESKQPLNVTIYCSYSYSKFKQSLNQPPIELEPKEIWLKKRKQKILNAIIRYTEAEIVIPVEWAKELKELEERGV